MTFSCGYEITVTELKRTDKEEVYDMCQITN